MGQTRLGRPSQRRPYRMAHQSTSRARIRLQVNDIRVNVPGPGGARNLATTPTKARPGYGFMNFFLNTGQEMLPSAPGNEHDLCPAGRRSRGRGALDQKGYRRRFYSKSAGFDQAVLWHELKRLSGGGGEPGISGILGGGDLVQTLADYRFDVRARLQIESIH